MKILITGGAGFLGSNISASLASEGHEITILDNLSRTGSRSNLEQISATLPQIHFHKGDIRDAALVSDIISSLKPHVLLHFAGQVAMTTSIEDPRSDFDINVLGTLNILEAIRAHSNSTGLIFSSTNKVYGDLKQHHLTEGEMRYSCVEKPNGFDETTQLSFHSPYGCSKGAADQYVLDYSRVYGLNTAVFRHSSMYGGGQHATFDQGWIAWFCSLAIKAHRDDKVATFPIAGNGKQVRDVLHATDMCQLYTQAIENLDLLSGEAFNIGAGIENSLSLRELFQLLESLLDVEMTFEITAPRSSDQKFFVSDTGKITKALGWQAITSPKDGIGNTLQWIKTL